MEMTQLALSINRALGFRTAPYVPKYPKGEDHCAQQKVEVVICISFPQ